MSKANLHTPGKGNRNPPDGGRERLISSGAAGIPGVQGFAGKRADRRRLHSLFSLLLCVLFSSLSAFGHAQQIAASSVSETGLPEAPWGGASIEAAAGEAPSEQPAASMSGIVLDSNGNAVSGATVTLVDESRAEGRAAERLAESDSSGRFSFTGLPPGKYRVTITSAGLETFVSPEIALRTGEKHQLAQVALPVAATTSEVHVVVTQNALAEEQVKAEVKQRVLGVIPNFYSSYIWNAAPLSPKQKFELAIHSVTDPIDFLSSGVVAGIEQARNTYRGYGQGAQGYAKRYGADYGTGVIGRMLGSAILPSILHQDPRYFYKGSGSIRSRALYAIGAAVICKGDNGHWQPNYSHVLGSFGAGAISNAYHPAADRGAMLTIDNGLLSTAGTAVSNLAREFLFRKATPSVPDYQQGKP